MIARNRHRWPSLLLLTLVIIVLVAIASIVANNQGGSAAPAEAHHVELIPPAELSFSNKSSFDAAAQCQAVQTSCRAAVRDLINVERAKLGVPKVGLDWNLSRGVGCPGAIGHAKAMAITNTIWHFNPQYPQDSFNQDMIACVGQVAQGQNIGAAWGLGKWGGALANHEGMMAEPHDAQTCAQETNHACTIINPRYTEVGIAFASNASGGWFLVEDFEAR